VTFASLEFLFFFMPAFFVLYYAWGNKHWRNLLLFVGSVAFYSWGEPVFVLLMLGSVLLNYLLARGMAASAEKGASKAWLVVGVVANLGMLGVFKYTNFVLQTVGSLAHASFPKLDLPLPLGISFYTFQALAYLIDLYRGEYEVQKNPFKLALAIANFSTITAGPILRYKMMREQLDERPIVFADAADGLRRFCVGMGKKILIANNVAFIADRVFSHGPAQYGAIGAWIGALAWTLQIYFDFSGYSDMAIGLGKMMGFRYPENFNYPYVASSVSDFWRRWHMSLSSFFRDYVYIPLGGNRVSQLRWVLNMGAVWALTGLWHGANWTFVAWGVYYGVMLMLEKFFLSGWLAKLPRFVSHAYTLLVVIVGWVFFMSPTITGAGQVLGAMVGLSGSGLATTFVMMRIVQPVYIVVFVAAIIGSVPWYKAPWLRLTERPVLGWFLDLGGVAVIALSAVMMVVGSFSPFLYFKF